MSELLDNIREQPESLGAIASYAVGEGRSIIEDAAKFLTRSSRIVFIAVGGSRYAAMASALFLSERGIDARVVDAAEILYYDTSLGDTSVVLVSRSGRTVEALRVAERLRRNGVSYVSITNDPNSPIAEMAGISMQVACRTDTGVSLRTYTGAALALLYLSAQIAGLQSEMHNQALAMIEQLKKKIAEWEQFGSAFGDADYFSFLGRGYLLGVACESCLLFQELARRPANWYSGAEFRQGPIEVLRPGHAVIVFAPESRTRQLDTNLLKELRRTGASVTEVGSPWPGLPEHLAAVSLIIPVQFAAYYLAMNCNSSPGTFRFASLVTESE